MSTHTTTRPTPARGFLRARSELVLVAIVVAIATVLIAGSLTMTVLGESTPGPQFVPMGLGVMLLVIAAVLAIDTIRNPEADAAGTAPDRANFSSDMLHDLADMDESDDTVHRVGDAELDASTGEQKAYATRSDWRTLGTVLVAVVAFVLLLQLIGWVFSSAALFWVICRALGSKKPVNDIWVSLLVASLIQLIFGGLLGLSLPVGFLGGL